MDYLLFITTRRAPFRGGVSLGQNSTVFAFRGPFAVPNRLVRMQRHAEAYLSTLATLNYRSEDPNGKISRNILQDFLPPKTGQPPRLEATRRVATLRREVRQNGQRSRLRKERVSISTTRYSMITPSPSTSPTLGCAFSLECIHKRNGGVHFGPEFPDGNPDAMDVGEGMVLSVVVCCFVERWTLFHCAHPLDTFLKACLRNAGGHYAKSPVPAGYSRERRGFVGHN